MDVLFCDELAIELLNDEDFPDLSTWIVDANEQSKQPTSVVPKDKVEKAVKPKKKDKTMLPPCRVCGGSASGFHFGVITCEACKVNMQVSPVKFLLNL